MEYENLREQEFDAIKKYINYDQLVLQKIEENQSLINKWEVELFTIKSAIKRAKNDIERIIEEKALSNHKYSHLFIDPTYIYYRIKQEEKLLKKK